MHEEHEQHRCEPDPQRSIAAGGEEEREDGGGGEPEVEGEAENPELSEHCQRRRVGGVLRRLPRSDRVTARLPLSADSDPGHRLQLERVERDGHEP